MIGTLYVITNRVNGMQYVGKTYKSANERFQEHVRDSRKERNRNRKLYQAMHEFGVDNFYIMEIGQYEESELERKEIEYIHYYDTYRNGYNQTLGGDGKRYIDINKLIRLYEEHGTVKKVAEITGHDKGYISTLLKQNGASVKQHGSLRKQCSITIVELDKSFRTLQECSDFLISNNIAKTNNRRCVDVAISRVIQGKRSMYRGLHIISEE